MALAPMDFSGEVKPLTAGVYKARIVSAEVKASKAGNPYVNWTLETFGSPEVNGKRVYHATPLSGGWVTKLAELHKAATGEDIDKEAKSYDPEMLVSKEVTIALGMRSYTAQDGTQKESTEVKSVSPNVPF